MPPHPGGIFFICLFFNVFYDTWLTGFDSMAGREIVTWGSSFKATY